MTDYENPYQSPVENSEEIKPLTAQGVLTDVMVKNLSSASPWLRFVGVMGIIGAAFYAAGGIITLLSWPLTAAYVDVFEEVSEYIPDFFQSFGWIMVIYALFFIGAGAVTFFPALFTYRFGDKIRKFIQTNSEQDLEQAFKNNKFLWKFNGILLIIALAAIPAFFVLFIMIIIAVLAIG